jgi:hypothetical protein
MKHLLTCLLIGCLVSPAWGTEQGMTLEEFVQKLEKAEPWTREKVEAQLGIKLALTRPDARTIYSVSGSFVYGKELAANKIRLEVSAATNKTNMLIVVFDDNLSCFTLKQIEKSYPKGEVDFLSGAPWGILYYIEKRSWGELSFKFASQKKEDCLTDIAFITNEFIKHR